MNNTHEAQRLKQERSELNLLIGQGVSFEVKDHKQEVKTRLFGLLKTTKIIPTTRKFTIHEPTLATLDRLSREWVEMAMSEVFLQGRKDLDKALAMLKGNTERCARVLAIATLGEERLIPQGKQGRIVYREDTERLDELTELFARCIKPSELYQLTLLLITMCNLGDFMNSIRLMSVSRTTQPERIEDTHEG